MGGYFRYQHRAAVCAFEELRRVIREQGPGVVFAGVAAFLALPLVRLVPLLRQQQVNIYQEAILQLFYGMVGPLILLVLAYCAG